MKTRFPHLLFLLSLSLLTPGCHPAGDSEDSSQLADTTAKRSLSGAAAGWNVILVSVDTVRADRLGAWGYEARPTSPRIDTMASGGMVFEQAYAQRTITWPSLGSVLTGLYPSGHGITTNGYGFPDDLATLPKMLQEAGYRTGAFIANMCKANHQGWDAFRCVRDPQVVRHSMAWFDGTSEGDADTDAPADESVSSTDAARGATSENAPFFLWAHYFAAHSPYHSGGHLAEKKLNPGYEGPLRPDKKTLTDLMTHDVELSTEDIDHLDAIYDAAIIGTDRKVGGLLDELEKRGLLERTVIVFLADHGEDLWDHNNYIYHACSVYQSSLHVPLSIVAPGLIDAGGRVAAPVELIDVMPTLLDLLGIEGGTFHGRSLVPYLERPDASGSKPAFSEYGTTEIHSVVDEGWKLIVNPDSHVPLCYEEARPDMYPIGEVELYHLTEDPEEQINLAEQRPDKVEELRALMNRRFAELQQRNESQDISEELAKELRALGYVVE